MRRHPSLRALHPWTLSALVVALGSCQHEHAISKATTFVARVSDVEGTAEHPVTYAAVHVDHLRPGSLPAFTEARRSWLVALSKHETTDGRGLFVQTGDSGFLSIRPLHALGDLDRQATLAETALANVDPLDRRKYDGASDALLVPPHRSEIWRYDESLSYRADDPSLALARAAWGKMTVEEIDPTPAGEAYEQAWKEIRAALVTQSYPLVRVAYWSRYGTGDLVTFWLSKSQQEFLETKTVEASVAAALGTDEADALFTRLRKTVLASDSIDVIPRLDLSSKAL